MSVTEPSGVNGHAKPTARPVAFQGDLANLPEALTPLKEIPNWVCWKFERRADKHGGDKWTKPPFRPQAPAQYAKNNDPATWGSYQQALAAYQAGQCDGIGFALVGTKIAAFDLDKCRNPVTGEIAREAFRIVERSASYTEITPSGTGLRVIGYGIGGQVQRKQKAPGSAVEVETYRNTERYITISGNPLPDPQPQMADIDGVIDAVVAELDGIKPDGTGGGGKANDPRDFRSDLEKWIEVNGDRHASADDFLNIDDRYLPPKLKALIANAPPAKDLSAAFHHAVCWLHELKWSARKIDSYIDGKPVVPQRYEGRLQQEIYRCLCNAERSKANTAKANTANEAPQGGGLPLEFYEDFDKTVAKKAIIKGVLYKGERSSWVGPPGSGKSALLADLAIHAAEGSDWRGHRSKEKVAVVYFALERKELVKRRLRAHARPQLRIEMKDGALATREVQAARLSLPIAVAGKAIDLLSPASVDTIVETIGAAEAHYGCPVGLIIIDTFNKGVAMGGGDENAAKDQNITAANLQQVQDQTDAHIALIGHTGKDESPGARGSNAHLGDVDMMVQISVAEGVRTAAITKINDGVEGVLTRFHVVPVTLGRDEDGDLITTAIVSHEVPAGSGGIRLNKKQSKALEMLEVVLANEGEPAPASAKYPKGSKVVSMEKWRSQCFRGGLSPAGTKEATKRAFNRAARDLIELHRVGIWDELVWVISK